MYSSTSNTLAVVLVAAILNPAQAHTALFYAGANGKLGDRDVCLIPSSYGNAPVKDLTSPDLRCRSKSISSSSVKKCPVPAGETLSVQWQHIHNSVTIAVMSASHQGPCLGYMAPLESNGEGDVWFKIYEEGWNKETKKWCTNKVIDNDGKLDITIPKDIPDGDYLVRTELIALHQAKQTGGAQLYPNCVVITVAGGTATALPKGYAIPGIYKPEDKGILYDRASDPSSYEIPGPPLFTGSSSGKSNTPAASNNDSESSSKAPVASKNEPAISMHVEPSTSAAEGNTPKPSSPSKACLKRRGNKLYRQNKRESAVNS